MGTRIVFITGSDTGVGKTLLTALLLCHLRSQGSCALALKPFCSGSRADAQLLYDLQDQDLTLEEINPFYFPEPVAPLVSARRHKRSISLDQVVRHITSIASRLGEAPCLPAANLKLQTSNFKLQNYLLIEGSGGLLVPLGESYNVRDLITRLSCDVIVVSRNQLGTINHTLLTVQSLLNPTPRSDFSLQPSAFSLSSAVLMDSAAPDASSWSNAAILSELLAPIPLFRLPFFGPHCSSPVAIKKHSKGLRKTLSRLV